MKYFLSLFFLFGFLNNCLAQVGNDSVSVETDTVIKPPVLSRADSVRKRKADSIALLVAVMMKKLIQSEQLIGAEIKTRHALRINTYFNFFGKPHYEVNIKRADNSKDGLFYLLTGVVLYLALVKLLFKKYMNNLFAVFFKVSLKQKQMREQLLQSPLPSLLLNIFFVVSGGIYINFLLRFYNFHGTDNLWYLIFNSTIALGLVYLVKYIFLKFIGWVFHISEAIDTYTFVVFLVNKLLGILLIPILILLAFSAPPLTSVLITLSFTLVTVFFFYRYIVSYGPVRKEIKVSQLHFLLYLCAFEIIPLLLIYKVLLTFLEKSY